MSGPLKLGKPIANSAKAVPLRDPNGQATSVGQDANKSKPVGRDAKIVAHSGDKEFLEKALEKVPYASNPGVAASLGALPAGQDTRPVVPKAQAPENPSACAGRSLLSLRVEMSAKRAESNRGTGAWPEQAAESLNVPPLPSDCQSSWGARRFDDEVLPRITYDCFGHVQEEGAQKIREFVEGLKVPEGWVVALRGQKTLAARVTNMPEDVSLWPAKISSAIEAGQSHISQRMTELTHYDAMMAGMGQSERHEASKALYAGAGALDGMVENHKSSYGTPVFVSATRSLEVAAGHYNMRNSNNRNRFIYVLCGPTDHAVNIHATNLAKTQGINGASSQKKDRSSFPPEQEIAFWLDATPFVAGVFDACEGRFIDLKNVNALNPTTLSGRAVTPARFRHAVKDLLTLGRKGGEVGLEEYLYSLPIIAEHPRFAAQVAAAWAHLAAVCPSENKDQRPRALEALKECPPTSGVAQGVAGEIASLLREMLGIVEKHRISAWYFGDRIAGITEVLKACPAAMDALDASSLRNLNELCALVFGSSKFTLEDSASRARAATIVDGCLALHDRFGALFPVEWLPEDLKTKTTVDRVSPPDRLLPSDETRESLLLQGVNLAAVDGAVNAFDALARRSDAERVKGLEDPSTRVSWRELAKVGVSCQNVDATNADVQSSATSRTTLPVDALTQIGATLQGETFILDGPAIAAMSVHVRQISDPRHGNGAEFSLRLTPNEARKLALSFKNGRIPGVMERPFEVEQAEFKNGVTELSSSSPYLPMATGERRVLSYRIEELGKFTLDFVPAKDQPMAYREKLRLRVFGATDAERRGNLEAALARIKHTKLMNDADPIQQQRFLRMSVLRMINPKKAQELSSRLDHMSIADLDRALEEKGVDGRRLANVRLEEVCPGHVAPVDSALGQAYADLGISAVMVGVSTVQNAVNILANGGLLSSVERFSRGFQQHGESIYADVLSGGAEFAFTRLVTRKAACSNMRIEKSLAAGDVQFLSTGDEMVRLLSRTDWHAYPADCFGNTISGDATKGDKYLTAIKEYCGRGFSDRPVLGDLVEEINHPRNRDFDFENENEACFKHGVAARAWTHAVVQSDAKKEELKRALTAAGIKQLGGRNLDDAIIVADTWQGIGLE